MDGFQPGQANDAVKFADNTIKVRDNIIARIPDVAGIKANADLILKCNTFQDGADFLKAAPHFRTLASHGLKKQRRLLFS